MEKNEKFERIYKKIVDENSAELECQKEKVFKERKKNVVIGLIVMIGLPILTSFIIKILKIDDVELQKMLILYTIANAAFLTEKLIKNISMKKFEDDFKNKVIQQLIKSFDNTLVYKPKKGIDYTIYEEAEFDKFNRYDSSDLITGNINGRYFLNLADVIAMYEKGKSNKIIINYFSGLFARIETPQNFDTTIYIRKDLQNEGFMKKIKKIPFEDLRVNIDSLEFEKIFDIYTDDKIVAMQLLTSDIMELMINFYNKFKIFFDITIKNNYIYIRFHTGNNFETAPLNKFALDKEWLYENYRILDFVLELTNKFVQIIY